MKRRPKANPPAGGKPRIPPFSDSVSQTLARRRRQLGFRLDEVVAVTKISRTYIKAMEEGDYEQLPHNIQSLGLVKRYARLLKLDQKTAGTKYLLERGQLPEPSGRLPKSKVPSPIVGTRVAGWLVFGGLLVLVISYLVWQLLVLTAPPRLSLSEPRADQVSSAQNFEVKGQTTPGAEVKVNGQIVFVDDNGDFSARVILNEGLNIIKVEATNRHQQTSTLERSVLYRPAAP